MARNYWSLVTPSAVALAAGVPKTIMQFISPNASALEVIQEVIVSFDGATVSATPTVIQLVRKTAAATVTARARVKTKDRATALVTDLSGTGFNATDEGTDGALVATFHIHPQAGVIYPVPLEAEVEVAGSGIIAVKVTAVMAVNCLCTLRGEE